MPRRLERLRRGPSRKAPAKVAAGALGVLLVLASSHATAAPAAVGPAPSPLTGARLFVDSHSPAAAQAREWRANRPHDAAQIEKIAGRPQADWFGGWHGDVYTRARARLSMIRAGGALPVFVAYNIPRRDCSRRGGARSAGAYRRWVAGLARAIGSSPAVVVLEPDALVGIDCLSAVERRARLGLLRHAVRTLEERSRAAVYLDAGHSRSIAAETMAARLAAAGGARAQGFALNVSNFNSTAAEVAFGRHVSARIGGKHFIVDTSRNGLGPAPGGQWCNPPGRALGVAPTTATDDPVVDAYLWIKRPGESDRRCGGGPRAGAWWGEYALGLAERAP